MSGALQTLLDAGKKLRECLMTAQDGIKCVQEKADAFAEEYNQSVKNAIQAVGGYIGENLCDLLAELEKQACDCSGDYYLDEEREWNQARQREAIRRDQAKARARYTAHRSVMAAHKSRQQLRRRKYRGGANAGVY